MDGDPIFTLLGRVVGVILALGISVVLILLLMLVIMSLWRRIVGC